ncbi:MAG: MOSC domain-containing protein, partial [Caulobacter sp.]|nr:MOSC domain-containing protein [Caulobacter sp.]
RAEVLKPIVRCAATHVDPVTAERDIELVKALFDHYGHMFCGVYLNVEKGGAVREGDVAALA